MAVASMSKLSELVKNFRHLFSECFANVKVFVHKVNMKSSVIPVKPNLWRLAIAVPEKVSEHRKKLERAGVILRLDTSE